MMSLLLVVSHSETYNCVLQKGALGRGDTEDGAKSKMSVWYAMPCPVPGVGKYSLVYATQTIITPCR